MKIAQVCPYDFSRPGGVKNHIESLSKYLRIAGYEVKIIAPKPNVNLTDVHHFGANKSVHLGGTKIDVNIALGEERRSLKEFLHLESFDIIHFHTFWNPVLPFQIRRFSRAKHVVTFHDTPKYPFLGKYVMPLAAKGVFRLMDAIISVSKTQTSYINRFSKRAISIIPNGIDLEFYNQPVEEIEKYQDDKFNLLFLGRLEERKGLIYALESFKAIKQGNDKIRLIIAGDGAERIIAEDFIKKHHLQDVEILGFVSELEKLKLLKTADLYLAPAIFGESFGIVLLEAMAMGTPICGFGNEGYLNVLSKDQKAYFPAPRNLDEFTKSIVTLVENPKLCGPLIDEGKEICLRYDWGKIAKKIESIYTNVLS